MKKKDSDGWNPNGLIVWWSTFHQRWNATPWVCPILFGKLHTTKYRRKNPTSDKQLLKMVKDTARRMCPETKGTAKVIEPGYSAIWFSNDKHEQFLTDRIEKCVCQEF